MHGRIVQNVYYLSLNYLLNKNATVLEKIKHFFIEYSNNYQTCPYHGMDGSDEYFTFYSGRLQPQSLDESSLAVKIVVAYDIVYEDLSREERAYIENNFLRPMYVTIKRNNAKESNWQSWHNAAMTGIGIAINDKEMVKYAVDGETNGFKFHHPQQKHSSGI